MYFFIMVNYTKQSTSCCNMLSASMLWLSLCHLQDFSSPQTKPLPFGTCHGDLVGVSGAAWAHVPGAVPTLAAEGPCSQHVTVRAMGQLDAGGGL